MKFSLFIRAIAVEHWIASYKRPEPQTDNKRWGLGHDDSIRNDQSNGQCHHRHRRLSESVQPLVSWLTGRWPFWRESIARHATPRHGTARHGTARHGHSSGIDPVGHRGPGQRWVRLASTVRPSVSIENARCLARANRQTLQFPLRRPCTTRDSR